MKVYIHFIYLLFIVLFSSCSVSSRVKKDAAKLLSDSLFIAPHTGISIYEPASGKYWYNHNSEKYFIPASNTKLFTLYAGLKYLGDSLPAARIENFENEVYIYPTGDPTFLHADFKFQPLYSFMKNNPGFKIVKNSWNTKALGYGWSWDDYNEEYMAERSLLPVYGNVTILKWKNDSLVFNPFARYEISSTQELPLPADGKKH